MKTRVNVLTALSIPVALMVSSALGQTPLGTAFTYQGKLDQSGAPVNATADFQFSLFDAALAGNLIAGPVAVSNVAVADGLFTVSIDFGAAAFNGQARWLSTAVRSPAGGGAFTTLTTRQKLTAAPYALKVPGIDGFSLDAADGSPADALFVDNSGNVGIGTTTPQANLHVRTANQGVRIQGSSGGVDNTAYLTFANGAGIDIGYVGDGGDNSTYLASYVGDVHLYTAVGAALTAKSNGNVGIGATNTTSLLTLGSPSTRGTFNVVGSTSAIPVATLTDSRPGGRQFSFYGGLNGIGTLDVFDQAAAATRLTINSAGNVGIGTTAPQAKLDVDGTARVNVLEITGADIAEKFPVSEKLEPGMVVAIDKQNPGKLCLARGAYNRCVAGIVSGANEFSVGAVLGSTPESKDAPPIALSGRVYVHCDATSASIEPGDLLTAADTPGHAMKVIDYPRAQGAIIGKAMTGLDRGQTGMVLVLVSLQ